MNPTAAPGARLVAAAPLQGAATDLRGGYDKASQAIVNVQAGESLWFELVPSPEPGEALSILMERVGRSAR